MDCLTRFNRLTFMDVIDALDASPKPTILVLQQKFPPEIAGKVGLSGANMTSAMKAVGCLGVISNGPFARPGRIRPMKFQYMRPVCPRGTATWRCMR